MSIRCKKRARRCIKIQNMSKAKKKGKKGAEERVPLLGRPGNNVKMGIVGMPSKSWEGCGLCGV